MTRLLPLACLLLVAAASAAAQQPGATPAPPPADRCSAFLPAPMGGRDRFRGAAPDDIQARAGRLAASLADRGDLDSLMACLAARLGRAE